MMDEFVNKYLEELDSNFTKFYCLDRLICLCR